MARFALLRSSRHSPRLSPGRAELWARWNLVALVAAVAGFVVVSGPGAVQATAADPVSGPVLVVDTVPGAGADVIAATAEHLADRAAARAASASATSASASASASALVAAPVTTDLALAGGTVTITQIDPVPADVLAVVTAAVTEWDKVIDRNGAPLEIELEYHTLDPDVLGAAGPYTVNVGGTSMPVSLRNAQLGYDAYPTAADISMVLNANRTWNTSLTTPNGDYPLITVVLHELGHGFGFTGSTNPTANPPSTYARTLYHDRNPATPYVGGPSGYATSDNLWARNRDATWERAYAPVTIAAGSSISHLNEATYTSGTAGSLMTPFLSASEFLTTVDPVTAGVMDALGWDLLVGANPPLVSGLTYADAVNVTLTPDPATSAPPAATFEVTAIHLATSTTTTASVAAAGGPFSLFSPLANGDWRIEIRGATSGGVTGAANVSTLTVGGPPRSFLSDQIRRLYRAYFLREADSAGLAYWVEQAGRNGVGLAAISAEFARSAEFQTRYGSVSDGDFVNLVYGNVLGRSPDSGGLAYWAGQLAAGVPRGVVMTGFSESTEFVNLTGTSSPLTPDQARVWRLYLAVLDREPDTAGLVYWTAVLGSVGLESVAAELARSPEFQSRYGPLDNTAFITQLYRNVLERDPDPGGLDYWLSELRRVGRSATVTGFSESTEFVLRTDTPR